MSDDYIKKIHKENKDYIKLYNIKVGDWYTLKNFELSKKYPLYAKVTTIHSLHGWVLFNNKDTSIPQRPKEFLKLYRPRDYNSVLI